MMHELQIVLRAAQELPTAELPRLLGDLREIEATAMARLTTAAPEVQQPDQLLDVGEAAARLGVSPDFLYRRSPQFPFTRRLGRRLLFSALGIDNYLKRRDLAAVQHGNN